MQNRMCVPACVLLPILFGIANGNLYGQTQDVLTAAEAIEAIGQEEVVVRIQVRTAKNRIEKRGVLFLDSEEDFNSETNLGIAVSARAASQLKARFGDEVDNFLLGKSIRVRGTIMRFDKRFYLPVLDAAQLTVENLD